MGNIGRENLFREYCVRVFHLEYFPPIYHEEEESNPHERKKAPKERRDKIQFLYNASISDLETGETYSSYYFHKNFDYELYNNNKFSRENFKEEISEAHLLSLGAVDLEIGICEIKKNLLFDEKKRVVVLFAHSGFGADYTMLIQNSKYFGVCVEERERIMSLDSIYLFKKFFQNETKLGIKNLCSLLKVGYDASMHHNPIWDVYIIIKLLKVLSDNLKKSVFSIILEYIRDVDQKRYFSVYL